MLLKRKDYEKYACIKRVAELRLGIKTIFATANKLTNPRFDSQNASNIALKYNLKRQGTNHILGLENFASLRPAQGSAPNTIVIGADVTHPGANSSPGTPSVAAVVGNTDDEFMHFPGSMRLQRGRKEFIIELGDMVKERLIDWAMEHNRTLPRRMLFYRDGVSETQYQKLRDYEIAQIQKAYNWAREYLNWLNNGCPTAGAPPPLVNITPAVPLHPPHLNQGHAMDSFRDPWPPVLPKAQTNTDDREEEDDEFADNSTQTEPFSLTYVVVGKRHNTRFYPLNAPIPQNVPGNSPQRPMRNGNVHPGLVIDQVITHPHSLDFYLQSHDPIHGTGRSAHYFVLQNEMALSTAELQNVVSLSNFLPKRSN